MKMISLIIFGVICLGMDVVYSLFNKTKGYKAVLIKGITVLASCAFAVICANLNSLTSALPLFVYLGFGFCLLSEAMTVSQIDEEKPRMMVFGFLKAFTFALFAVGAVSLTGFNVLVLGGGLLLGLGVGCVVCAIKKYKRAYQAFSTIASWAGVGLLLCEGAFAVFNSIRMISSVIMLGIGLLLFISHFIESCAQEGSKLLYVSSFMYALALSLFGVLIYF